LSRQSITAKAIRYHSIIHVHTSDSLACNPFTCI